MTTHHGLDTDKQVFFYEQEFYPLSNFSSFGILNGDTWFMTSEHLYHWFKFKNHPHIQKEIIDARSAHDAFSIAQKHKHNAVSDWGDIKFKIMFEILWMKTEQHEYVKKKLLETGDRELIENSWRDDVWGWGENKNGNNALGKIWMQIRENIRTIEKLKPNHD